MFPILNPTSRLTPHTIPLGHPGAQAPSILYHASNLDWRFVSYKILYMFQCHSAKSSHPPSPTESKRLFYTFVSLLLSRIHALEKEMTTHSSILAWRIPGKEEPGRLRSMGSHRLGHDLSYLATAAALDV